MLGVFIQQEGAGPLQDIVNELGRRLEFDVENGRYQGTHFGDGSDGIWRFKASPMWLSK